MYKKMNELVAFIKGERMWIILPGKKVIEATKAKNESQWEIIMNCPNCTKEEFEKHLKTKNSEEASFELMYYINIDN